MLFRSIDIADLGYAWVPGQQATICFDLNSLPNTVGSGHEYVNVLESLVDGVLECYMQDDTMINYMHLKVRRRL